MPTSIPAADQTGESPLLATTVYGLSRRSSAKHLISALKEVPCLPGIVFRLDRLGRLFGVVDHREPGQVLYVRVHRWGSDETPSIGWTWDPAKIGRAAKSRAEQKLVDYVSGVRQDRMTLHYRDTLGLLRA